MKKLIILAICSLSVHLGSCQSSGNSNKQAASAGKSVTTTVSVNDFETKMTAADAQLVDVRTPGEYAEGHLKNATNIDFRDDAFEANIAKLDKKKPVFVYCRSGGRSAGAAEKMQQMGFTEIYNMDGGITSWTHAEKPVTK